MAKQQQAQLKPAGDYEPQPPGGVRGRNFAPTRAATNRPYKSHQQHTQPTTISTGQNVVNPNKPGYNNKAEKFLSRGAQAIVRMRGLPFTCSAKQVVDFFASPTGTSTCQHQNQSAGASNGGAQHHQHAAPGKQRPCEVLAGEEGVLFVKNSDEKPTGDAFVLFATEEQAKRALARHHQNIGSRYVELFRSTVSEVQQVLSISTAGHQVGQSGDEQVKVAAQKSTATTTSSGKSSAEPNRVKLAANSNQQQREHKQQQQQARLALTNKSAAFPALTSQPVVWRRSETVTYAQVAHSKESAAKVASYEQTKVASIKTSDKLEQPSASNREAEKSNGKQAKRQQHADSATSKLDDELVSCGDSHSTETSSREKLDSTAPSRDPETTATPTEPQTPVEPEASQLGATPPPPPSEPHKSQKQEAGADVESAPSTPQAHSPNSCSSSLGHNSAGSSYSSTWRQTGSNQQIHSGNDNHQNRRHNNYQQHRIRPNQQHNNATTQHNLYSAAMQHHQQSLAYGYALGPPLDPSHQHAMALAQSQPLPLAPVSHYSSHPPYAYGQGQAPPQQVAAASAHQSGPMSPESLSHHPANYYPIASSAAAAHYIAAAAAAAAAAAVHQQQHQQHQVPSSSSTSTTNTVTTIASTGAAQAGAQSNGSGTSMGTTEQQVTMAAPATNPYEPQLTSQRDCIRLRGLPFEAQIEDVIGFLGRHSEFVLYQGVHMVYSAQGQPTGEAIIQMSSCEAASAAAQEAHRRVMTVGKKQRYIEVIPSSIDDLKPTLGYGLASFAASRAAAAAAAAYNQLPVAGMHHHHYPVTTTAGSYLAPTMIDPRHHLHHLAPAMIYDDKLTAMVRATGEPPGGPTAADCSAPAACCSGADGPPAATTSQREGATESAGESSQDNRRDQAEGGGGRDVSGSPSTDSCASSSGCATASSVHTTDDARPSSAQKPNFDGANPEQLNDNNSQLQQQQQALMAATAAAQAAAAAYYPIFYYYPPQQMLATAPTANTSPYH